MQVYVIYTIFSNNDNCKHDSYTTVLVVTAVIVTDYCIMYPFQPENCTKSHQCEVLNVVPYTRSYTIGQYILIVHSNDVLIISSGLLSQSIPPIPLVVEYTYMIHLFYVLYSYYTCSILKMSPDQTIPEMYCYLSL